MQTLNACLLSHLEIKLYISVNNSSTFSLLRVMAFEAGHPVEVCSKEEGFLESDYEATYGCRELIAYPFSRVSGSSGMEGSGCLPIKYIGSL